MAAPQECLDAANEAEILRKDVTKLTRARDRLRACAVEECPTAVRADCQKHFDEVEATIPSVLLIAEDDQGNQLFDAKVMVDGAPLVEKLDGKPVVLDGGARTFTFQREGVSVDVKHVLEPGGKNTRVVARFTKATPAAPVPVGPVGASDVVTPAASSSGSPLPTIGLVTAGIGGVGLIVGTIFGLSAGSKKSDAGCDPNSVCPDETSAGVLRDAQSAGNMSTAFFIAGGVLVAGGLSMFFLAPKHGGSTANAPQARLRPAVGPGVAGLVFEGVTF